MHQHKKLEHRAERWLSSALATKSRSVIAVLNLDLMPAQGTQHRKAEAGWHKHPLEVDTCEAASREVPPVVRSRGRGGPQERCGAHGREKCWPSAYESMRELIGASLIGFKVCWRRLMQDSISSSGHLVTLLKLPLTAQSTCGSNQRPEDMRALESDPARGPDPRLSLTVDHSTLTLPHRSGRRGSRRARRR